MTIGAFFMLVSSTHWVLRARSLRMESDLVAQFQEQQIETPITPTHISIQWFVDADIEPHIYQNNQWTTSTEKASYLSQSAQPGTDGNIIVYGHNTRAILGNIRALKGSETIVLTLSDGSIREYQISKIIEVSPTQTEFLKPTQTETLTLYTCSGFLDKNRFIVQAVPINAQPK